MYDNSLLDDFLLNSSVNNWQSVWWYKVMHKLSFFFPIFISRQIQFICNDFCLLLCIFQRSILTILLIGLWIVVFFGFGIWYSVSCLTNFDIQFFELTHFTHQDSSIFLFGWCLSLKFLLIYCTNISMIRCIMVQLNNDVKIKWISCLKKDGRREKVDNVKSQCRQRKTAPWEIETSEPKYITADLHRCYAMLKRWRTNQAAH